MHPVPYHTADLHLPRKKLLETKTEGKKEKFVRQASIYTTVRSALLKVMLTLNSYSENIKR